MHCRRAKERGSCLLVAMRFGVNGHSALALALFRASRVCARDTSLPPLASTHPSVHKLTCDFLLLQSLEKYLHGPMKGKNLTDEVIDQRAAELAKAHHDAQQVRLYCVVLCCVVVFLHD